MCKKYVTPLFVFWLLLLPASAPALELIKDALYLNTYLRGTGMIGKDFNEGQDLSKGANFELTLFDDSYFETELVYNHAKAITAHAQLALNNFNLFYYTGDTNADLVFQNFYAEAHDFGAPGNSFWIGSRKYRRIDEHTFFGAGYKFAITPRLSAEAVQGVRKDFAYWGAQDGGHDITLACDKPFRMTSIIALEQSFGTNGNLVLLGEFQRVGPVKAEYKTSSATYTYDLAPAHGALGGAEVNLWGTGWNTSTAATYGFGDTAGGPLSKINAQGEPVVFYDSVFTKGVTVLHYKNYSQRFTFTQSGAIARDGYSASWLLGFSFDDFRFARNKAMNIVQARPFYHITPRHHVGADISRTSFFNGYTRPGYFVLAPVYRYSLMQDNYCKPYLQLFFANGFYDHAHKIYDLKKRYTWTLGMQFEVWF